MAYLYNVVDITLGPIGTNVTTDKAAELANVRPSKIPEYAKRGTLVREQYRFYIAGDIQPKFQKKGYTEEEKALIKAWDEDMMVAARLLREEKGRMIYKYGRRSHVVPKEG